LMTDLGMPTLSELGYDESDIPDLVEGALAQQRLLVGTPRPVSEDDVASILRESLHS
jgi:hydroxyacid-oxoacid transhydrogenase